MVEEKNWLKVSQLTDYERRRLNQSRQCLLCGQTIQDYEHIVMIKKRNRRNMLYSFAHFRCVVKGGYDREWLEEVF